MGVVLVWYSKTFNNPRPQLLSCRPAAAALRKRICSGRERNEKQVIRVPARRLRPGRAHAPPRCAAIPDFYKNNKNPQRRRARQSHRGAEDTPILGIGVIWVRVPVLAQFQSSFHKPVISVNARLLGRSFYSLPEHSFYGCFSRSYASIAISLCGLYPFVFFLLRKTHSNGTTTVSF
jgi:hypothetical protein